MSVSPVPAPAPVRNSVCDARAKAYADAHLGSGDPTGDIVDRAMDGAVEGGIWAGPRGARKGARAGGALAVLDNYAAYPGGWQALYDIAYRICEQEQVRDPATGCRSSAVVNGVGSDGLTARSGCR